ncbi:hypothetical protein [Streptomyces rugosispiralis]|uniref:TIR domain-containing protein n=1 Tax=Streptomyces rugosispiralis TaxID=2967341 RepID=A0ABT1UYH2_9ACTN|nr:hypothetical protein [Streptomyces rugosispiralis]MCQ8190166.1 hypothetical protein [Streptomyces rugosispiralis]
MELLRDLGCLPVVDTAGESGALTGGDMWHHKLMRELRRCQATVLLLSPHALTSRYVLEEAFVSTYLCEATNSSFLLLPVTLPGVNRRKLADSDLAAVRLDRFDMADWTSEAGPMCPPRKLTDPLRVLVERCGSLPYPRVTEFVADRIESLDTPVLMDTAELLGVTGRDFAADHMNYVISAGLLSERPVTDFGDECAMRKALSRFLPLLKDKELRRDLVDVVVPFARVPGTAAQQLHGLRASADVRIAILRAQYPGTADMYLRRASEAPEPWVSYKPVPRAGVDFLDGLVEDIRAFLTEEIFYGGCDEVTMERVLAREENEQGPVTVVLNLQPDRELVDRLKTAFPRLLFVFAHGQADAGASEPGHVRLDFLTPSQEQDMISTHRRFSG